MRLFLSSLLFFTLFFLFCSPKEISDQDYQQFIEVYVEISRLRENRELAHVFADSTDRIIEKHGFTKEQYQNIIDYLNNDLDRWHKLYSDIDLYIHEPKTDP